MVAMNIVHTEILRRFEFWECLLSFDSESFVFPSTMWKCNYYSIWNYDFCLLDSCTSMLRSHGTIKKLHNLLSKSNIKLNTTTCLSFINITCKKWMANFKLINNLIVSPDISTLAMASLADYTTNSGRFWIVAAIDCMLTVTEWLVSNNATWILTRTYKFRHRPLQQKNTLPLCIFISQNPWHPFAKSSLRYTDLFPGLHLSFHAKNNKRLTVTLRVRPNWVRWLYLYPEDRHHSYPWNRVFG